MPGLTDSLRIIITADGAAARREFEQTGAAARRNLGQAEQTTQRWSRTLTSAGVAMATFGGVALVGLGAAARAADEENQATLRLNNSIANSPVLVGANTQAFLDQAAALQDTTRFADDATVSAQAMLATFRLNQDQILQLTPLVQDLAAKFGVDLVQAATAVGKAAAGNTGTLRRWGVFIDEGANSAENFDNLLAGLRENAGGFAEAEGRSMAGQLDILKNNLGDVAEGIGQGVIPVISTLLQPLMAAGDAFSGLDAGAQATVGTFATVAAVGTTAAGVLSFGAGQALRAKAAFDAFAATNVGSRLTTLGFAGSLGVASVALTAGVGVLASYIAKKQQAEARTRAFTEALEAEASGASDSVEALIGNIISTSESLGAYAEIGVSVEDVAAAISGNAAAFDRVTAAASRYQDSFDPRSDAAGYNEARGTAEAFTQEIVRQRDALGEAATRQEVAAAAAESLATGFGGVGDAAADAEQAISDLSEEIDQYLTDTLGVGDAQDALQSSFNDLYAQLLGGNRAFRGNSDAAIENRAALDEIVRGTAELIDVQQQQGAGERVLQQTKQRSIARIREAARQHLIERGAAREAIAAIRGIPARTNYTLVANADVSGALAGLDRLEGRIRDVAIAYNQADFNRGQAATGGSESAPRSSGGESAPAGRRRERAQPVLVVGGVG